MTPLRQWPAWLLVLILALAACGRDWEVATRIDADWYRRNLEEAHLARWLAVAPTPDGFFNTAVDRRWQPVANQPGDLAGQARVLYVMAMGYEVTARPTYLEQVRRGADFLIGHYRDARYGGWFEAVAADGSVKDGSKRLSSQATALFALAHAYRVSRDERHLRAALETWTMLQERFAAGDGSYRSGMNREFTAPVPGNNQNPLVHLFAALLVLHDASGVAEVRAAAEDLGNFVAYRLLQGTPDGGAFVAEAYDAAWKPLDAGQGGRIDIGRQFEWAYLFSIAAERGLNPVYVGVAERLLKYAMDRGYDRADGGVFSAVSSSGRRKGGWQQAEALRALMHHAVVRGRDDLWAAVTQMTDFVRTELVDEENGGWHVAPRSECKRGGCADRQPDGYHMVALHREALRLAELARQRR